MKVTDDSVRIVGHPIIYRVIHRMADDDIVSTCLRVPLT